MKTVIYFVPAVFNDNFEVGRDGFFLSHREAGYHYARELRRLFPEKNFSDRFKLLETWNGDSDFVIYTELLKNPVRAIRRVEITK